MKRAWICAFIMALASSGVCVRASGAEQETAQTGKSRATSSSHSRAARKGESNKKTKGEEQALKLAPVTVEAARIVPQRLQTDKEARETLDQTPGGVGLVTQEHIDRRRASTLADVLDLVPGVIAGTRAGANEESAISIRGSGLESAYQLWGLNLLQDGFSLNQADGFAMLQPLDLDFIRRIEVYKGANALRFGADSLGGAINLVSKTGYDTPLLETDTLGGSFGYLKNYLGSGRVIGPWDYYVGLSDTELGGYRQHSSVAQRRASQPRLSCTGRDHRSGRCELHAR